MLLTLTVKNCENEIDQWIAVAQSIDHIFFNDNNSNIKILIIDYETLKKSTISTIDDNIEKAWGGAELYILDSINELIQSIEFFPEHLKKSYEIKRLDDAKQFIKCITEWQALFNNIKNMPFFKDTELMKSTDSLKFFSSVPVDKTEFEHLFEILKEFVDPHLQSHYFSKVKSPSIKDAQQFIEKISEWINLVQAIRLHPFFKDVEQINDLKGLDFLHRKNDKDTTEFDRLFTVLEAFVPKHRHADYFGKKRPQTVKDAQEFIKAITKWKNFVEKIKAHPFFAHDERIMGLDANFLLKDSKEPSTEFHSIFNTLKRFIPLHLQSRYFGSKSLTVSDIEKSTELFIKSTSEWATLVDDIKKHPFFARQECVNALDPIKLLIDTKEPDSEFDHLFSVLKSFIPLHAHAQYFGETKPQTLKDAKILIEKIKTCLDDEKITEFCQAQKIFEKFNEVSLLSEDLDGREIKRTPIFKSLLDKNLVEFDKNLPEVKKQIKQINEKLPDVMELFSHVPKHYLMDPAILVIKKVVWTLSEDIKKIEENKNAVVRELTYDLNGVPYNATSIELNQYLELEGTLNDIIRTSNLLDKERSSLQKPTDIADEVLQEKLINFMRETAKAIFEIDFTTSNESWRMSFIHDGLQGLVKVFEDAEDKLGIEGAKELGADIRAYINPVASLVVGIRQNVKSTSEKKIKNLAPKKKDNPSPLKIEMIETPTETKKGWLWSPFQKKSTPPEKIEENPKNPPKEDPLNTDALLCLLSYFEQYPLIEYFRFIRDKSQLEESIQKSYDEKLKILTEARERTRSLLKVVSTNENDGSLEAKNDANMSINKINDEIKKLTESHEKLKSNWAKKDEKLKSKELLFAERQVITIAYLEDVREINNAYQNPNIIKNLGSSESVTLKESLKDTLKDIAVTINDNTACNDVLLEYYRESVHKFQQSFKEAYDGFLSLLSIKNEESPQKAVGTGPLFVADKTELDKIPEHESLEKKVHGFFRGLLQAELPQFAPSDIKIKCDEFLKNLEDMDLRQTERTMYCGRWPKIEQISLKKCSKENLQYNDVKIKVDTFNQWITGYNKQISKLHNPDTSDSEFVKTIKELKELELPEIFSEADKSAPSNDLVIKLDREIYNNTIIANIRENLEKNVKVVLLIENRLNSELYIRSRRALNKLAGVCYDLLKEKGALEDFKDTKDEKNEKNEKNEVCQAWINDPDSVRKLFTEGVSDNEKRVYATIHLFLDIIYDIKILNEAFIFCSPDPIKENEYYQQYWDNYQALLDKSFSDKNLKELTKNAHSPLISLLVRILRPIYNFLVARKAITMDIDKETNLPVYPRFFESSEERQFRYIGKELGTEPSTKKDDKEDPGVDLGL